MDSVVSSINDRFKSHKQLYKDFSCLDPRRFQEISQSSAVPDKAFDALCKKLGSHVDSAVLRLQLTDSVASFQSMSKSLAEEYEGVSEVVGVNENENENENESYFESGTKKTCRCCVFCAFKLLYLFSLHSSAYSELYIAYKYLITLSVTQVKCERCFSTLKFVKNRLRSTMAQNNLESVMLMYMHKTLLHESSNEKFIDIFAKSSAELRRLLLP